MDLSPYLSAVQSLQGETPGEKYKSLHSIAAQIIANAEELSSFAKTGETSRVPAALHPTLRILVGLKLKSRDAVIAALKSDDVTIIKLALGARWFFSASNDLLNVDYFADEVLPFVSLKTRIELVKTLARHLKAPQAESFHRRFVVLFGSDQALPLLAACGEDYVYGEISRSKIYPSERMLRELYRKYPQTVIKYLRLVKDDKKGKGIGEYHRFLPCLLRNHTREFVELYQSLPSHLKSIKLGGTRAEFFLRNSAAVDFLIESPDDLLLCLPLKLVKSRLDKEQYDVLLRNLLPKDVNQLRAWKMCDLVRTYYPKEGGFELFRKKYNEAYGKDMLERKDLLEEDCIYEILPEDVKAEISRKFVSSFVNDKQKYWKRVYQLPPKESIPLLKEQINKSTVLAREECLNYMLRSCDLYKSKADLLEVLKYYNTRHKNEQDTVLLQWLQCLSGVFDKMESLEKEHWQVVKEIVWRAYVKGDLFSSTWFFIPQTLFAPMLRYLLRDKSDEAFLDKAVGIVLEYYCEHKLKAWDFVETAPELEEASLEKFLAAVPQKYPESHAVWKKIQNKLQLTAYLVEAMGKFNERNLRAPANPKVKVAKMLIEYYPWLAKSAAELATDKRRNDTSKLRASLQKYFPEFYQNSIDESEDTINDVTTSDALRLLKRDPGRILSKVDEYAAECRCKLAKSRKTAKHFVVALKWYQTLPLKFVQKCADEIAEPGSVVILGILLEGSVLSKLIEPYLPKETELQVDSENAKKDYELVASLPRALNYANPPPPLEVMIPLCRGDYLSVALQTLSSIAQRLPVDRVLAFAGHLTNNAISVRKAGIRLVFQVSTKPQAREFLTKICKEEKNPGIREVVVKMVHEVFTQTPSEDSWQLMKGLIDDLLPDDKKIFDALKKLKTVSVDYVADYLLEIFRKIDSFGEKELGRADRSSLVRSFLDAIDDKQVFNRLPEDTISDIARKYLMECTLDFIFGMYLFSSEEKFEGRLKLVMEIFSKTAARIGECHPKRPRFYPTLKKFHNSFANNRVFNQLEDNENKEMNRRYVASVLENVSIRKDLECYLNYNIYRIFTETSDAKVCGEKCGRNIDELVEVYKSEVIIEHYGKCLDDIVNRSSTLRDKIFDIIEGLMSHKLKYGALVGLKLLSYWTVADYDERYDKIVEAAKSSEDIMVQAALYNFLSKIDDRDSEDCEGCECYA